MIALFVSSLSYGQSFRGEITVMGTGWALMESVSVGIGKNNKLDLSGATWLGADFQGEGDINGLVMGNLGYQLTKKLRPTAGGWMYFGLAGIKPSVGLHI